MKKKVCIFTSMIYPVPAVKGGAVEGLVELLVSMNEIYNELDLTVISVYDSVAQEKASTYKHTHFIFISKDRFIDKILSKKVFIYVNKASMKFYGKTMVSMPFIKKAMKLISGKNYDRYILEGGGDCYNFGYLQRIIPSEKLYVHFHGEVSGDISIRNWFGKCITVSNYIARKLVCNGIIDKEKVCVLPNCFDRKAMETNVPSEEIRKKYKIKENDIVYVYWGRLLPQKGVLELMLAYRKMAHEISNTKLLIIGNANFGYNSFSGYDKILKEICNEKTLKDHICFTGFVSHDHMGSILNACDIGIIPSIWDDPAPLTVFEGLSKGLPLIAGNVGGIPEVIVDGENGILIDWSEHYVEDLADKMLLLRNNKQYREYLSQNALDTIARFTPEVYYRRFVELVG